ncbi:hypothetical protein GOP47_0015079 [Adiantum capillus-veneris]|uniref:Uncharacterized protein n=1 Tax=Adiantum capillus-veneris TaxID=13818 RepID=A0A9D4ZFD8_ADICA|nr:hypothetical protein GOP47_0015079 [Adiantum capillus-veneris]
MTSTIPLGVIEHRKLTRLDAYQYYVCVCVCVRERERERERGHRFPHSTSSFSIATPQARPSRCLWSQLSTTFSLSLSLSLSLSRSSSQRAELCLLLLQAFSLKLS